MQEHKDFWDRNAGRYDRFMRKDGAAYEMMYEMIRPVVRHKTVLELATGTGLIAKHIVNAAALVEATDASAEMIAEAKRDNHSAKLHSAKRLDGAEKRCSKGILPADLCGMCEIGGVIRCHFLRTPESLWGLAGKSWSP